MKKVKVYKYNQNTEETTFDYEGNFHGFGINYEELETGPGSFSTCIVEKEDGSLGNIPVELCQFVNPTTGE